MTDVNYKFYIAPNGMPTILPAANIASGSGLTEVPFDQWKTAAQAEARRGGGNLYDELLSQGGQTADVIKAAENNQTVNAGSVNQDGNFVSAQSLAQEKQYQDAVKAGTMKTVDMGNGITGYVPTNMDSEKSSSFGLTPVDPSQIKGPPVGFSNASIPDISASSNTATKPGVNLQPGDKSGAVAQLQKYLLSQGLNIPSLQNGTASYGYYGPETQSAVAQLQQKLGMQVPKGEEGFFGPLTQGAITTAQQKASQTKPSGSISSNTAYQSTGDPKMDAAFSALKGMYDKILNSGAYTPNANLNITPELVSKFLAEAHQVVDPYTQQTLTDNIKGINSALQNYGTQYQNQRDQLTQDFQTGLATSRESDAGNGVAFSGLRGLNEANTAASTNRNLSNLDAVFANNIGGTLRTGGALVGNGIDGMQGSVGDFSTPQLNGAQVDTSGARGNVSLGGALNYNYDPGLYKIGSIGSTYGTNLTGQANSFLSNYQKSAANNGRTFQNLNGTPTL